MKKQTLSQAGGVQRVCARLRCLLIVPVLLFSCFGLKVSAQTAEPRVTVEVRDASISQVFQTIQEQTGFSFVYNTSDINPAEKVSLTARDAALPSALDQLFAGRGINYTVKDKHIVLSKTADQVAAQPAKGAKGVSGSVKDAKGLGLIGATVVIKGTTVGVAVDLDGNFTLPQAKPGDVLEVSLIGYAKQEVPVTGNAPLNIVMHEDTEVLDAVVVTALGIKRSEKALTYNVQEVSGDIVNGVKDANFVNALSGKVAGLQINASASGTGGSTRVVMRGVKSINGNNNALYVIDGIPMPSLRSEQTAGMFETPDGGDYEGISNLNPEDIESMSILSGATAAALYGSQGANGVILITTKKGEEGRLQVNYSNNTTFTTPFVMPQFQNRYGTDETSPSMSWGSRLAHPTSYDPKDFFQTGYNTTNSVSVSAGNSRNQTYASAASVNSRGIIPNNVYNRYNFSLRNTTELVKDKLTLDVGATYMRQYDRNSLVQGLYHNPLIPIYLFPRGDDIRKYQIYERYDATAGYMKQFWPLEFLTGVENPYWVTNRELFENTAHRYTFNGTMKWDITDWMSLTGRVRMDNTTMNYTRKIYASSDELFASEYGNYLDHTATHNNLYADALLSIDKMFLDDRLSLQFNLGASLMDDKNKVTGFEGHLATQPNKFTLYNIDMKHSQTKPYISRYHDQVQAVYATLQLGWKGMIYLDVTARNEWASQLAFTGDYKIFYPSVGLSAVISSMTDLSKAGISFLKVRASYAEVGNAPMRWITIPTYPVSDGVPQTSTYLTSDNFQPERTKSWEIGADVRLWGNKLILGATYYNSRTYNQVFNPDISSTSTYSSLYVNAGRVDNKGIELSAELNQNLGPVEWTSNVVYSRNRNKVVNMLDSYRLSNGTVISQDSMVMGGTSGVKMVLREGGQIGDIYVNTLKTDEHGMIWVSPTGSTVAPDKDNWIYAGNSNPSYTLSWRNEFRWKGLSLAFMFNARVGGVGVSLTQATMDYFGVSERTAIDRDNGGALVNGQRIPAESFYQTIGGNGADAIGSMYVYSMTNVRLGELTLGYDIPVQKWCKWIKKLNVSFVGRNLWMLYCKAPFDPESVAGTGTYSSGIDYFMQPSTRNLGFSVKVTF